MSFVCEAYYFISYADCYLCIVANYLGYLVNQKTVQKNLKACFLLLILDKKIFPFICDDKI